MEMFDAVGRNNVTRRTSAGCLMLAVPVLLLNAGTAAAQTPPDTTGAEQQAEGLESIVVTARRRE